MNERSTSVRLGMIFIGVSEKLQLYFYAITSGMAGCDAGCDGKI